MDTNKYSSFMMPMALLLAVYMVVKSFGDRLTKDGGASNMENTDATGSTLTDLQAKSIADNLYQLMGATFWGKGSQLVKALKDMSNADFSFVYQKFGLRQYSNTWGNVGDPLTSDDYDLTYWLRAEMSDDDVLELERLNPKLKIF